MNVNTLGQGAANVINGITDSLKSGGPFRRGSESSSAANLRAQHGTGLANLTELHAKRL
jgi:hypothetical protein